jgi:hypothetical protein
MGQNELSSLLAPILTAIALLGVGLIARAILKRIPEGRVKRVLSWPPDKE